MASGSLYADQAEQIKREQMELEEKMSRDLAQQRAQQTALLKEKLAQRKKERLKKLREQQEIEKAKVNCDATQTLLVLLFLSRKSYCWSSDTCMSRDAQAKCVCSLSCHVSLIVDQVMLCMSRDAQAKCVCSLSCHVSLIVDQVMLVCHGTLKQNACVPYLVT